MKTRLNMLLLAGALGFLPGKASAQVTGIVHADIPFKFIVEATTLGPGKYTIRPTGQNDTVLEIAGPNGHVAVLALTERTTRTDTAKTELIFHKHGDQEFLSQVFVGGNKDGDELVVSRLEKKLDDAGQKHEIHSLPATHRKAAAK